MLQFRSTVPERFQLLIGLPADDVLDLTSVLLRLILADTELFEECCNSRAEYFGFKEEPLPHDQMTELYALIKKCGKKTVLEVVAYDEEKCLEGAKLAVKCGVDMLMGTMYFDSVAKLCRENGLKVPGDISVVGIDDSRYASICEVPLTTVHHPHRLLGEAAANTILDMINSRTFTAENKTFAPKLIVRSSVAKLG